MFWKLRQIIDKFYSDTTSIEDIGNGWDIDFLVNI